MAHAKRWVPLSELIGAQLPLMRIVERIKQFNARDGLLTLSRISADLANAEGGILGPAARAWSHDLLAQRVGSPDPVEDHVSRAVTRLSADRAIIHGQVVFLLQFLLLKHGTREGRRPGDGELAFLMLALNDHIPWWPEASAALSTTEDVLATMFFMSVFNETSDDALRFLLRVTDIVSGDIAGAPIGEGDWMAIQEKAFGCSFSEYAEYFLVPMFLLSRSWGYDQAPLLLPSDWTRGERAGLFARWFAEASLPIEEPAAWMPSAGASSATVEIPGVFYRTPFVQMDDHMLCLSPWHMRDHAILGTWAKLNGAAKEVLGTSSNQRFAATFGYLFERWCASLAKEAARHRGFKGRLLVPSSPGATDEIEDVVVVDRERVALFSVKASLVKEPALKTARSLDAMIEWLRRFFFANPTTEKQAGYRGGALWLLDQKIERIRTGAYESRGLPRNSLIIPVVVSFDKVGESGILYRWIEEECSRLGILSARPNVRPLTILTPEDYEGLLALGTQRTRICDLLIDKTRKAEKWGRTDAFLLRKARHPRALRLPDMEERFHQLVERSIERLRAAGQFEDPNGSAPASTDRGRSE